MSKEGGKKDLSEQELKAEQIKRKESAAKSEKVWAERARLGQVQMEKFKPVINLMLQHQPFFHMLFEKPMELEALFTQEPQHQAFLLKFAKGLAPFFKYNLGAGSEGKSQRDEREVFLLALHEMELTQGYSMLNYLKINLSLGNYLSENVSTLEQLINSFNKANTLQNPPKL